MGPERETTISSKLKITRWVLLALIIASGTMLRAAYNANTLIDDPIRADAAYYLIYAHNLIYYSTFSKDNYPPPEPDSYWAPGYPAFLAAVIKLSGETDVTQAYYAILFAQLLLGVGTMILCYLVAVTFLPGLWGLLPTLFTALSPHLVSAASYALTETLFGFSLLLATWLLILAIIRNRLFWWLLAGIAYAIAYLVNPVSLFLPFILGIGWLWSTRVRHSEEKNRGGLLRLVILLLPLVITVAAWSARNAISVPEGQPTSSGRLLTNLASGIYPEYHEKWRAGRLDPESGTVVPGSSVQSYTDFFEALSSKLGADPMGTIAWYGLQKPLLLWSWDIKVGEGDIYIYKVFYSLYHTSGIALATYSIMRSLHPWLLAAAAFALIGLYFERQPRQSAPVVLYATLTYISLIYIATQAAPRYSIPLRPEFYLCATFALWALTARIKGSRAAASNRE